MPLHFIVNNIEILHDMSKKLIRKTQKLFFNSVSELKHYIIVRIIIYIIIIIIIIIELYNSLYGNTIVYPQVGRFCNSAKYIDVN
jgi:hypothetical protein